MYDKVFISYAKEDYKYAEGLHTFLEGNGYRAWCDKINLLPGQNWEFVIQQELRKTDFIILLLSGKSVNKRGYVQKEFNTALNYCEEKLESDIYIIPIKLDSCEVPDKLSKYHWIEYSTDAHSKILESLAIQKTKLHNDRQFSQAAENGFELIETTRQEEYGEKTPKQLLEIKYKLFNPMGSKSLEEINTLIESENIGYLVRSRNNYYNHLKDISPGEEGSWINSDSECFGTNTFHLTKGNFVSYSTFWSLYESGAAHGNYWTHGYNYYLDPLREFVFLNLFTDYSNALKNLRDCVDKKLMEKAKRDHEIESPNDFYLLEEMLEAKSENFENFYLKEAAVVFIYNPYQLTAFAFGDHHVEITFEELKVVFPEETELHLFLDKLV